MHTRRHESLGRFATRALRPGPERPGFVRIAVKNSRQKIRTIWPTASLQVAMAEIHSALSSHPLLDKLAPIVRQPGLFIGHGSLMNAIKDNHWRQAWQALGRDLLARPQPLRLVLCISAHWLTMGWQLTAMAQPRTNHDFGGFPQALFDQQYPAPGSPWAARFISQSVLQPGSSRPLALDEDDWGLDPGAWSILKLMFLDASIPVIQLSMDYSRPPVDHFEIGRQLASLRERGVLIV